MFSALLPIASLQRLRDERTGSAGSGLRRAIGSRAWLGLVLSGCLACGDAGVSSAPAPERHLDAIGVQLFTLRGPMEQDFEGTLRSVASMGYAEVEFAGLFGHDPVQVRVESHQHDFIVLQRTK